MVDGTTNQVAIACGDNTPVSLTAPPGDKGGKGDKGDSCSAALVGGATDQVAISCGDAATVTLAAPPGAKGDKGDTGDSCSAASVLGTPDQVAISCGNAAAVTLTAPPGAKGDKGDTGNSCSAASVAGTTGQVAISCGNEPSVTLTAPQGPKGDTGPPGVLSAGMQITSTITESGGIENMQPFLVVNFAIALVGIYPSRDSRRLVVNEGGKAEEVDEEQYHRRLGSEPFIAEIMMFAGNFPPRGYAFCDGQLLSIAQNTALFSLLGTTYGGDGRTTFALPDLRGRVPMHAGARPGLSSRDLGTQGGLETVSGNLVQTVTSVTT